MCHDNSAARELALIVFLPLIASLLMLWTASWLLLDSPPICKAVCAASCRTVCDTSCQTVGGAHTRPLTYVASFPVQTTVDEWGRVKAELPQGSTRVELRKV
ncbi:hypothetical protein ASPACDRAFT_114926 [Aspergillus aculeatus ATCC 16872]|uniref:Uncharacterized protein n=1 Tax=Aspergillus aculeatus (strain ATCC 16872 / CBS 172.66 / WB 5094) TaxID=690307 RepID=A0A1L9X119_ASPA1|nr:uncharacterized protein ASPACDRAFT_114926 [Aspergillus aculeatus ATCC 16872]OJK02215.1 hypothetical protein ASPACDRAFT_114926 [Aspergillus aculeatus ATCC 16872]